MSRHSDDSPSCLLLFAGKPGLHQGQPRLVAQGTPSKSACLWEPGLLSRSSGCEQHEAPHWVIRTDDDRGHSCSSPWSPDSRFLPARKSAVVRFSSAVCIPAEYRFRWRRKWQPTPVLFPGKSHGQRSLAGYSPWGRRVRHALVIRPSPLPLLLSWHFHPIFKTVPVPL